MELEEFIGRLRQEKGAVRVEVMPDDLCDVIETEEATVSAVNGMLPVKNSGLKDYLSRNTHLVVFDDGTLFVPEESTMDLLNGKDEVIGRSILPSEAEKYAEDESVIFISEDFIMFTDKELDGESYMDLKSSRYRGQTKWVPDDTDCMIWFSSSTSSDIIHRYFGQERSNLATALIGLNL